MSRIPCSRCNRQNGAAVLPTGDWLRALAWEVRAHHAKIWSVRYGGLSVAARIVALEGRKAMLSLLVNGKKVSIDAKGDTPLL